MGDDTDDDKNQDSPSGVGSQWKGDEIEYVWHCIHRYAYRTPPPTVKQLMKMMFIRLLFS